MEGRKEEGGEGEANRVVWNRWSGSSNWSVQAAYGVGEEEEITSCLQLLCEEHWLLGNSVF